MKRTQRKTSFIVCLSLLLLLLFSVEAQTAEKAGFVYNGKTVKKLTIYKGEKVKLELSGVSGKVKWSTSKKSVATIKTKGTAVTITGKSKGSATISAKVGKKTYKLKVTVKNPPAPKLSATKGTISVKGSASFTITNKVIGKSSATSSNKKVATVKKISNTQYTVTGLKAGKAVITVKANGKKVKYTVTVTKKAVKPVYKLSLEKTSITVVAGKEVTVGVTASATNGTAKLELDTETGDIIDAKITKDGKIWVKGLKKGYMPIIVNYGDKTVTLKVTVTAPNTTVPSTPTPTPQPSTEEQTEKQTEKTTEAKETGESESKVTTERTVYSEEELNAMLDEWIADIENKCGFNDSSLTDLEKLTNLTKYMATNFPYTRSHSHYFYCMKEYVDTDPFGEGHVWGCDCVGYAGMIVDSAVYSLGYSEEDAYMDQDSTGHKVAYVKIDGVGYTFDAGSEGELNRHWHVNGSNGFHTGGC